MVNDMTETNIDLKSNKRVLRCVYGKGIKYFLNPCRDPKTKRFPECVRPVDDKGNIILTQDERVLENNREKHFIAENEVIEVEDNTTFDLNDIYDKARWEAIEHSSYIAMRRDAKDAKGNLLIDGDSKNNRGTGHSGLAELYVDIPGLAAQKAVSKIIKKHNAVGFIINDERGYEGRLLKARLLGRNMSNQTDDTVQQYLLQIAENDPDRIISLYTGDDLQLRILFLDAKDKHIIVYKNKAYQYGENIIAATDDAVLNWMKQSKNSKMLELIKQDTYPDLYTKTDKK